MQRSAPSQPPKNTSGTWGSSFFTMACSRGERNAVQLKISRSAPWFSLS